MTLEVRLKKYVKEKAGRYYMMYLNGLTSPIHLYYERDYRELDLKNLNKLADLYYVKASYLLGRTDDPSPISAGPLYAGDPSVGRAFLGGAINNTEEEIEIAKAAARAAVEAYRKGKQKADSNIANPPTDGENYGDIIMKKSFALLLTLLLTLTIYFPSTTSAETPLKEIALFINGNRMALDHKPLIEKNSTLVPFTPILKELGYSISFDNSTKTVTAKNKQTEIKFTIGSKTGYVNGKKKALSIAPKIINGTTYVPVRFISDASNEKVTYDPDVYAVQVGKQIKIDHFFKMSWDMTPQQVKKAETGKLLYEDKNDAASQMHVIAYETAFPLYGSTQGTISYYFENNKLVESIVSFDDDGEFKSSYQNYIGTIFSLEERYGKFTGNDMIWDTDQYAIDAYWSVYKNDFERMVYMAMLSDELSFFAAFSDGNKEVSLLMYNGGSFSYPEFSTIIGYSKIS